MKKKFWIAVCICATLTLSGCTIGMTATTDPAVTIPEQESTQTGSQSTTESTDTSTASGSTDSSSGSTGRTIRNRRNRNIYPQG